MAGVVLALALVRLIVTLGPATIPGVREAALDCARWRLQALRLGGGRGARRGRPGGCVVMAPA